jgi:hypothetical protein
MSLMSYIEYKRIKEICGSEDISFLLECSRSDVFERIAVCRNKSVGIDILMELARDSDDGVRMNVALYSRYKESMLISVMDTDIVRRFLAWNECLDLEVVKAHLGKFEMEWFRFNGNKELVKNIYKIYDMYVEVADV